MATLLEGDASALSAVVSPSTGAATGRGERGARRVGVAGTDGVAPAAPTSRLEKAAKAAGWYAEGWTQTQIAVELGISRSYAAALINDPDGSKDKQRKQRYAGVCVECGAPTSGSEGRVDNPRCGRCGSKAGAAKTAALYTVWTPDLIVQRIQEWAKIYGEPPACTDWNPEQARRMNDPTRAQRFHDANHYWPWFTQVINRFGSWNAAIEAAGFTPRHQGGHGNPNPTRRQRRERTP